MFDNNVFLKDSCRNYCAEGKVAGFELATNITYYRGIPLSMVEFIKVAVDGAEVPNETILISVDKIDWFTLKEAETVVTYKWEYGEPLYIRVPGEGLSRGEHKVRLTVATRTAYIPVPIVGVKERTVVIE